MRRHSRAHVGHGYAPSNILLGLPCFVIKRTGDAERLTGMGFLDQYLESATAKVKCTVDLECKTWSRVR